MLSTYGSLPSQSIQEMMTCGFIDNGLEANVNPASLDLTVSDEVYQLGSIFQPRPEQKVREILAESESVGAQPHSLTEKMEIHQIYLARLNEQLRLPSGVYGHCNPKSSIGRLGIHVRVIADGVPRFDSVSPGFKGELWAKITPHSFPIRLAAGERLTQLRFFNGDTRFDELHLQIAFADQRHPLLFDQDKNFLPYDVLRIKDNDGSLILTVNLEPKTETNPENNIVGWECQGSTSQVLDLSKRNYSRGDFFRPVRVNGGRLRICKDSFYILWTKERLLVPPHLTCEMVPMDERFGEFRSHYAGFIDPGWGWGENGQGRGRPLVLELRAFEENLVLMDNQPIAKVRFERMREVPELLYDIKADSHYNKESDLPPLSRHFREWGDD